MNKLFTLLFLLTPILVIAQTGFSKKNSEVLKYKDHVESLSDTTMIVIPNMEFTKNAYDGGAELRGIYHNGKLIKITAWFGLSYGINSCNYYLKDGKLYLVEEIFKGYKYNSELNTFDYSEFDIFARGWYLFKLDKLIDTESLGHFRFEDDTIDPEKKLVSEFNEYRNLLTKK